MLHAIPQICNHRVGQTIQAGVSAAKDHVLIAAVVAVASDVVWQSDSAPLLIDGGRFFLGILKMPVATATATEILRGTIGIDGWTE